MRAQRAAVQPPAPPPEVTITLALTPREATALMSMMGMNITVPDVVAEAGYNRADVKQFMNCLFSALRDAGVVREYGAGVFSA